MDRTVLLGVGVLCLGLLVAVVILLVGQRRLRRRLDDLGKRASEDVEWSRPTAVPEPVGGRPPGDAVAGPVEVRPDYVITTAGDPEALDPVPIEAGRFVSIAAGESLVRLLALGHGLRRALSAENRNRIAFEMRREVRRSRKQRRRDLKTARRTLRAAQRNEDAA